MFTIPFLFQRVTSQLFLVIFSKASDCQVLLNIGHWWN